MEPTERDRIDQIIAFHSDLARYRALLAQHERSVKQADQYPRRPTPDLPAELEPLRQSLLRRSGPVKILFERIVGTIVQPQPYNLGPPINVWELALHENDHYNQDHFLGVVADYLNIAIGRLEDDATLLDAPKPQTSAAGMLAPINVYGGTVNIAQTAGGDISQSITVGQDLAEVGRLLSDLEDAIRAMDAPEDERDNFLEPVEELGRELGKSRPLVSRLARSWGAIQAIAAIEGGWQGWDRVQHIAADLGPRVHDLIQSMARASGQA